MLLFNFKAIKFLGSISFSLFLMCVAEISVSWIKMPLKKLLILYITHKQLIWLVQSWDF
jgi:hypothetical protein